MDGSFQSPRILACGKNHDHFAHCEFSPGMLSTLELVPDCAEVNHISVVLARDTEEGHWDDLWKETALPSPLQGC